MKITKEIITIQGALPGKTSTIIAGIHGNEICGIKAFEELIPKLKINFGKVNFVYGNIKAIEKNKRQIDVNLNRVFRPDKELSKKEKESYEYQRAKKLKKILNQSDVLLDIHSSRNTKSVPFAIIASKNFYLAKKMPFKIVSSDWDKIEPGGTDDYMSRQNKINICAECGYNLDPKSIYRAKKIILTFLQLMGNITPTIKLKNHKQKSIKAYYVYHNKNKYFRLAKKFKDFEKIKKNTLIGFDGKEKIYCHNDSYIIFARNCQNINEDAFVLGK